MLTIREQKLSIYFGDASDGISKQEHCSPTYQPLIGVEPFKSVLQKIAVSRLSLLNQTHGTAGVQIIKTDISFTADGDYMITNQTGAGLGILTADCVPLILYDSKNQAIATIHAGWRGAVAGIVPKAVEHMQSVYQTDARDVRVFVGPSAKVCCYQVQEDFFVIFHQNLQKK